MTSKSTMSEKLAEAASVARRTGTFIDPRYRQEQEQVAMAPAFAVVTIEPRARMGDTYTQDFVINYPDGEVLIDREYQSTEDIDNPKRTPIAQPRREKVLGIASDGPQFEVDCLYIPSPYISTFHAVMKWSGNGIAITPFSHSNPDKAVPPIFVNEKVVSKGKLKALRPGDVIAFQEPKKTKAFCKWEVKRIAYGDLQPLTRSGNFEEEELAKLRQIGAKWSLDIRTVMVTILAMAILGGFIGFFIPDVGKDLWNSRTYPLDLTEGQWQRELR
ncbi:hypothetical protein BFW01_g11761 [Lasiodiplodia theobromae]|nr:hypothetical protein BFW01_g11761 [Lasiodiplodia theobromae]